MLIELVDIFKQQVEYLLDWVVNARDGAVALWGGGMEGVGADKHALEDADNFDLEFWVWDFLVDGYEDVEDVGLVLWVGDTIELGSKDA